MTSVSRCIPVVSDLQSVSEQIPTVSLSIRSRWIIVTSPYSRAEVGVIYMGYCVLPSQVESNHIALERSNLARE